MTLASTSVFYQLEKGDLLDDVIHRNIYVNNAIFAFAVLGMVKMLLSVMWLWRFTSGAHRFNMKVTKLFNYVTVYLFEDCCEMFLEYFFIEKYFTNQPVLCLLGMLCCSYLQCIPLLLPLWWQKVTNVTKSEVNMESTCIFF